MISVNSQNHYTKPQFHMEPNGVRQTAAGNPKGAAGRPKQNFVRDHPDKMVNSITLKHLFHMERGNRIRKTENGKRANLVMPPSLPQLRPKHFRRGQVLLCVFE